MEKKKVYIATLGCKLNQYESQAMRELLLRSGFDTTEDVVSADIFLLNSCVVTEAAEKECLQKINRAKRANPRVKVAVAGCLANSKRIPEGVDYVIPNSEKNSLISYLKERELLPDELKVSGLNGHTRAFVKVEDGCDNFCSYCTVPYLRGNVFSRDIKDIFEEIDALAKNGYREVVLTGINIGCYGKDLNSGLSLPDVVGMASSAMKGGRVRISSIEPEHVNDELLDVICGSGNICAHLHVPLQHGDDGILRRMNRRYTAREYSLLLKKAREKIKGLSITTDIIVGFPGESEDAFLNSLDMVKDSGFLKVHVFTYSDRPQAASSKFEDKIAEDIKKERHARISEAAEQTALECARKYEGSELSVLVESTKDTKTGLYKGLSSNYIRVFLENGCENLVNNIVPVRVTFKDGSAYGRIT